MTLSVYWRTIDKRQTVVFMGTYPPRECGIATFNQDLLNSSQEFVGKIVSCKVAAMNLASLEPYEYPKEVGWVIDQDDKKQHSDLAETINSDMKISGVIIQHEYGIYGGEEGENLLEFMQNCNKPIVVTLHTVLPHPSIKMHQVTQEIIDIAKVVIVLTNSSKTILESVYPSAIGKVHVIPHGIHPTQFENPTKAKKKLKLSKNTVLSTFGLLSRGKGIEYVIRALPDLIVEHPDLLYMVIGETHPIVRRREGESYRNELSQLVTDLHLEDHVKFYDQYLNLSDLLEFLKATDIYVSTSINPNQAVSGTLSYALGTGRAVISTEFAQAKEIIKSDTGRLVPIKSSPAYCAALAELLSEKTSLEKMHKRAYDQTRKMLWSNVANEYSKLLTQNILPPIDLTHLKNMTDSFGMFQFAALDIPDKKYGYTLDDNARALIVSVWMENTKLIRIYLNFINSCQQSDGTFTNYLDYQNRQTTVQNSVEDLEDATARAMWAVSEVMADEQVPMECKALAKEIFFKALPNIKKFHHIRSSALIIKSVSLVQSIHPEARDELVEVILSYADSLLRQLKSNSNKSWHWFDDYLSYNNAIVPESLFLAGKAVNRPSYISQAITSMDFLIEKTFTPNRYMPIGHSSWYRKNDIRSFYDQQPEDPSSMILGLVSAHKITHDDTYRNLIDICFSWFLGNNSLGLPLYNYENGGCYDGLHPDRVNLNQGAESQVSYLLSRLSISRFNQ